MTKEKKIIPTRTDVFDDFIKKDMPHVNTKILDESHKKNDSLNTSTWFESEGRKPRRVAMTFTLDPDVISLIEKAAEKHKLSRSRIIEKIALNTLSAL